MKCPHCDKPPYPYKDEQGNLNWKNILRIDWKVLAIVAIVMLLSYGYHKDTEICHELLEQPCEFVKPYNCEEINQVNYDPTIQETEEPIVSI